MRVLMITLFLCLWENKCRWWLLLCLRPFLKNTGSYRLQVHESDFFSGIFIREIFVWPWKMASVSVSYLFFFFFQPMDEKIKTWTLRFPAKENTNMEKALFDCLIVLQYYVKVDF